MPDALVNRWGYLVFNPRLRRVITQASNDDIQYLKAVIHDKRSTRQRIDYKVANLLVRIEAVDRERSSIDYHDDGDILGVDSLVLDQARIGDHSFFRLRELSPIVIVRDDIAEKIEKSGCTGIKFIAPEQLQF